MIRALAIASILSSSCLATMAMAQDKPKGFRLAPGTSQPKVTPQKGRTPAVVVQRSADARVVKKWDVHQEGSTGIGLNSRKLSVIVEDISLSSNGRMRWTFSIRNRGGTSHAVLAMDESYLTDEEGETYTPVAYEFPPSRDSMTFPAEAKKKFWLEFEAPKLPIETFKVAIVCQGRYEHPADNWKPFQLKLSQPISADGGEAEPSRVVITPMPVPVGEPSPTPPISHVVVTGGEKPSKTPPGKDDHPPLLQTLRGMHERGMRFEGTVSTKQFAGRTGGIAFDKKPVNELLTARLFVSGSTQFPEVKLKGALLEDATSPCGYTFVFEDKDELCYRFILDGKILTGTGADGSRYTLKFK